VSYSRELRIGIDIRRKDKIENVMEFVERIKEVQKEAEERLRRR